MTPLGDMSRQPAQGTAKPANHALLGITMHRKGRLGGTLRHRSRHLRAMAEGSYQQQADEDKCN